MRSQEETMKILSTLETRTRQMLFRQERQPAVIVDDQEIRIFRSHQPDRGADIFLKTRIHGTEPDRGFAIVADHPLPVETPVEIGIPFGSVPDRLLGQDPDFEGKIFPGRLQIPEERRVVFRLVQRPLALRLQREYDGKVFQSGKPVLLLDFGGHLFRRTISHGNDGYEKRFTAQSSGFRYNLRWLR